MNEKAPVAAAVSSNPPVVDGGERNGRVPGWAVEMVFWGALLVVLGHMVYGRVSSEVIIVPHGILGRILVLMGLAFTAEGARASGAAPVVRAGLVMVVLATFLWMGAWFWTRLALLAGGPSGLSAVTARRCEALAACADHVILFAPLRVARRAGVLPATGWRLGAGLLAGGCGLTLAAGLWLPRSWGVAVERLRGTAWLETLHLLQGLYWVAVVMVLVLVRRLRAARFPAAKDSEVHVRLSPAPAGESGSEGRQNPRSH